MTARMLYVHRKTRISFCFEIPLCLLLALLHVLVAEESQGAADQDDGVEADAHVGLAGAAGAGLRGGGGLLGFGRGVVGLVGEHVSMEDRYCCGCCGKDVCFLKGERRGTYATLEGPDQQALEDLAGLVAVADVFEGFGRVLAADVEENFFTARVLVYEACGGREWLAGRRLGSVWWVRLCKMSFSLGWWVGERSRRRRRRHTGAVIDLVVDNHVQIFLQEESAPIADFVV